MNHFLEDIKNIFRRHYLAGLFCFLVGFMTILPNLIFIYSLGNEYRGLYMMKADSEPYYLARIQEFYDGNGMQNPFIYEFKGNVPISTPSYSSAPVAFLGMLFGLTSATAGLLSTFILPLLVAVLIYAFLFQLTEHKLWSVAGMMLVTCGRYLLSLPDLLHLLRGDMAYHQFTIWTRPILPSMSFLVTFLLLNILLIALKNRDIKWFAYLGFLFGISFYVYFYSWTFILALIAVFLIFNLIKKDTDIIKKLSIATIIGFVVGAYSLYQTYILTKHPYYQFLAKSLGLISSHQIILSSAGLVVLCIFGVYFYKRIKSDEVNISDQVLLCLLATTFIVVNQQIITGRLLQEGHYHWYFNVPIYSIIIVYLLKNIFRNKIYFSTTIPIIIIVLSMYATTLEQYSSYKYWFQSTKEDQRYMGAVRWLEINATPESVIFANQAISELIPVFTANNVAWDVQAYNFLWSEDRANWQPEIIMKGDLSKSIRKYRADYLVWDKVNNPNWNAEKYSFLREVNRNGEIIVYKIEDK